MADGLEGVVAASTRLSEVDGDRGRLTIAGYAVDELAPAVSFEAVVFLLLNGRLPEQAEEAQCVAELAARRELSAATRSAIDQAAAAAAEPMAALRMAAATLDVGDRESPRDQALAAIAALPAIVGSYWRRRCGEAPAPIRAELSHAAHCLQQFFGAEPSQEQAKGLETYLNTVCDHGMNASTFAARVIVSTRSDVISAITGAIGALKGPLHGGAPGPALEMVFEIGEPARAEALIRAKLDRGERLMGFGHRVYRVRDPRADVLARAAERFYATDGDRALYALATHVEQTALRVLRERKPDRAIQTNVEFYTALLLHGLGIPTELFTSIFAIGRVAGWTAHCLEQLRDGRLIRPLSTYTGAKGLTLESGNRVIG